MNNHPSKLSMVMLVDDSPIDIYINTKMLEQTGFAEKIVVMDTGQAALNYVRENLNKIENLPDLLFLDLNMPGVDGFDFLAEFKFLDNNVKNKIKIVVLTSSDKTEDIHSSINNPLVKRYFIKPLTEDIIDEIKRMIR